MKEVPGRYVDVYKQLRNPNGRRYVVIEGNQGCNRNCGYCNVPTHYNSEAELTVGETFKTIDWLYDQGYRVLSYLGGEPLAPFQTKEGISFAQHTLEVVKYGKQKGMFVNITTNGDYINPARPNMIEALKDAGLDTLTFSLHTLTKPGLRHLTDVARVAAKNKLVPTILAVMTTQTADKLPGMAARVAENGILFDFGLVQTRGDIFAREQDISVIPTAEQQKRTLRALSALKTFGFVRGAKSYLRDAPKYYPNNWTCDAERDTFLKIGAGGKVNVCSQVDTGLRIEDIATLDSDTWREQKRAGVSNCGNCLFSCYYEAQNPDIIADIPTIAVGLVIKRGGASLVEKWGQIAVQASKRVVPDVNWELQLA